MNHPLPRHLLFFVAIACATACGPKGSNKPATLDKGSPGHFIVRHPNFEGHLDAKLAQDGQKYVLKLEQSGFPEKSAITIEGKTLPLERTSGEVATSVDLSAAVGDAPIGALTGGTYIPLNLPFELTFFDKRQKVSGTFTQVSASLELRSCMNSPPCTFSSDGPANAKPNILVYTTGDSLGQKVYGAPTKVRDIDWVAFVVASDAVPGKKCKMKMMTDTTGATSDEHVLMREAERITVRDRRSGALLNTRALLAEDRCPVIADIKMGGADSGLRGKITDQERDHLYAELRGDAPPTPPAASSSAPTATTKPKKPGKK